MVKYQRIFRLLWLLGHVFAELTIEVSKDVYCIMFVIHVLASLTTEVS